MGPMDSIFVRLLLTLFLLVSRAVYAACAPEIVGEIVLPVGVSPANISNAGCMYTVGNATQGVTSADGLYQTWNGIWYFDGTSPATCPDGTNPPVPGDLNSCTQAPAPVSGTDSVNLNEIKSATNRGADNVAAALPKLDGIQSSVQLVGDLVTAGAYGVVNAVQGAATSISTAFSVVGTGIKQAVVDMDIAMSNGIADVAAAVRKFEDDLLQKIDLQVLPGVNAGIANGVNYLGDVINLAKAEILGALQGLSGGSKGGYDPSTNSVSGDCAAGFSCNSVDVVECVIALDQFKANCDQNAGNALTALGMSSLQNSGTELDGNPLRDESNLVDMSSLFPRPTYVQASCPADRSVSVMGLGITIPYAPICTYGSIVGYFFVLAAVMASIRIIAT